jgi:DNA repair exonuclease SbcCD ATPase subunit
MKRGVIAAVVAALALVPLAGSVQAQTNPRSTAAQTQQLAQGATPAELLQLVQQLLSQGTPITTAQLQALLTKLQQLQSVELQLQQLLTQLQQVQSPPAALTNLITLLQSVVKPTQLQNLITQLQNLLASPSTTQAQIQNFLSSLQTLLGQLQLTPAQVQTLIGLVQQLLMSQQISGQLLQLLRQLFVTVIAVQTPNAKVPICHRTHSAKHPFHTITVSINAMPAHLRHGDMPGACTASVVAAMTKNHHGKGHEGKGKHK